MKRAIRIFVLTLGLVGTYVAAALPPVPTPEGFPIPVCPPSSFRCK